MSNDTETTEGGPNRTTRVNTKNGSFTIVASVRMHSDGGHRGVEEDRMICLAVDDKTGELVSWDAYWIEESMESGRFGWAGGYYQPYRENQHRDENYAIEGFRKRVKCETDRCISRAFARQRNAVNKHYTKKDKGGEEE